MSERDDSRDTDDDVDDARAGEVDGTRGTAEGAADHDSESATKGGRGLSTVLPLVLIAALLAGGLGYLLGQRGGDTPSDTSVDAGFARDMQTHHDQAVEMSLIVMERTDDERIRMLAYDIARTQSHQSGQMAGWLQSWGLRPTSSEPTMEWMKRAGHDHGTAEGVESGEMPGMARPEDLARLKSLSGEDAEILFLQLMIEHHDGGVPMAEAARDSASRPEVVTLARSIIESQTAETGTMKNLLEERGGVDATGLGDAEGEGADTHSH